jgi:hypothetical protein
MIIGQTQILTSCIKDNFNKRGCCGGKGRRNTWKR